MRFIRFFALFCLSVPAAMAADAPAGSSLDIVAVVNEEAITTRDLNERVKFVISTSGLSSSEETVARLKPQLLRKLIDERLQLQAAAAEGVKIPSDQIQAAILDIEEKRGMPKGAIKEKLRGDGVAYDTFEAQIRAQMAWMQMVTKKLRPNVRISEEEIERARMKRAVAPSGGGAGELQIATLSLPVARPDQEAASQALAQKLVSEIRSGVPFENIASALSQSNTQVTPGTPFWVKPSDLDPAIGNVIAKGQKGEITDPIRTAEGFTIVRILDSRSASAAPAQAADAELFLKDILFKSANTPEEAGMMIKISEEIIKSPGNCVDPTVAGVNNPSEAGITIAFKRVRLNELPEELKTMVGGLTVGAVSKPFNSDDGMHLVMLCERTEAAAPLADREETYQRLYAQKMELEAQKLMRSLQRDAFIDIKN